MKIIVTGASGQIGSYVLENLVNKYDVLGVDLKPLKGFEDVIVNGDLRDYMFVEDIIKSYKPNIIIHLAAQVSVENSWKNPVYDAENNVLATINLLKASADHGVERFVYVSSAAVYGNPKYLPIDENHPLEPISPYGVSKLTGEYYCKIFSNKIYTIIIRPFNVFSERMAPSNPYSGVIAKFIHRVKRGLPPIIYGDGKQTRDFVHVKDVVSFLELVLEKGERGQSYNIGTGRETAILELAKLIIDIAGVDVEPIFDKPREGDIRRSCADISRAKKLGFRPKTNLKKDIKNIFNKIKI